MKVNTISAFLTSLNTNVVLRQISNFHPNTLTRSKRSNVCKSSPRAPYWRETVNSYLKKSVSWNIWSLCRRNWSPKKTISFLITLNQKRMWINLSKASLITFKVSFAKIANLPLSQTNLNELIITCQVTNLNDFNKNATD